jgi:hypothetical protein
MPQPVAVHPETLKIVQTIHDTVHTVIRDTIVRVAEPHAAVQWVSFGTGLATIIAAGVAVLGIQSWRHQAARDGFNHFIPSYAGKKDTDTPEFLERERKEYWNWMRAVVKSVLALKGLRAEAEIHWGVEGTQHIDAMDAMARRLRGGFLAYFHHRLRAVRGEAGYAQAAESDKATIFDLKLTDEDKDEYGDDLDRTVERARSFLKQKIDLSK